MYGHIRLRVSECVCSSWYVHIYTFWLRPVDPNNSGKGSTPSAMAEAETKKSESAKWTVKFKEGDRVYHKDSGRQGTVVDIINSQRMKIQFDKVQRKGVYGWGGYFDDREEERAKGAYKLGENGLRDP